MLKINWNIYKSSKLLNLVSENAMNEELVELTSEISLKQKLIEELETSQKRLHIMKQQYETKLLALEQRIVSTEEERDKVLKSLTPGSGDSPEKVNRIKQEYQEKLGKCPKITKSKHFTLIQHISCNLYLSR